MPGASDQLHHVRHGGIRGDVGIRADKACLVALGALDHGGFILNALCAVDERYTALYGKRDRQPVAGHCLHDRGHHGDIHRDGRCFPPAVLHKRCTQAYIGGYALIRRITGDQQVLIKSMRRFIDKGCHDNISSSVSFYRVRAGGKPPVVFLLLYHDLSGKSIGKGRIFRHEINKKSTVLPMCTSGRRIRKFPALPPRPL